MSCLYRQNDGRRSQPIDIIERLYKNVKCHIYLCGDFNVSLLMIVRISQITWFYLFLYINKPTCITRHSYLTDNIFANNIFHANKTGLLINDTISYILINDDHLPIFTLCPCKVKNPS